jgi:glyceraldehyde 3-phosphate dehydrogenase
MKIGINDFGRIGQLFPRSSLERGVNLNVVAINDRGDAEINAYLFQFDSTYGPFRGRVEAENGQININDCSIKVTSYLNPLDIPWRDPGVEQVIEATGAFTTGEQAVVYLQAGVERVLVTAPCKGSDVALVVGVNEHDFDPANYQIISVASCTTNGLAPIAKVPHEHFRIRARMMTTIHAYTKDQRILDRSHKDPRHEHV